jgi:hypothetical protein
LFSLGLLLAQKYNGPKPPKPDVPFLVHGDTLLTTEVADAKEEQKKDEITYVIAGAASSAKTPLAGPVFLLQSASLNPERLQLYRLEIKNGRREITFSKKKKGSAKRPLRITATKVGEDLYRIEVDETLENGEYSLTPEGSNQVFCFQVY